MSIQRCDEYKACVKQLLFIWRCFGDGIAAIYQSKYSLKHLYYDKKYQVKQEAGFLTNKAGFRREYRCFRSGIEMGVPVVMADLTNIIRHGDVCGLAGEDPLPIEIKSSNNKNGRVNRQIGELIELANFYVNDGAPIFRGTMNLKRVGMQFAEKTYETEINSCIEAAYRDGIASISPEPGLRYVAGTSATVVEEIQQYASASTQVTLLTPSKNWLPCYPFTLSLKPANAILFIQEKVSIFVLIDHKQVKKLFAAEGVHATALMNGKWAYQISKINGPLLHGVFRISELLFARISLEFQSLTWFTKESAKHLFQPSQSITAEEFAKTIPEEWIREIPKDWLTICDFYEASDINTVALKPLKN